MIRRAKISEIPDILTITQACAKKMQENGIFQWNECYPSKEAFQKDIDRGELFVVEEKNTVQGTIVISTVMDEEYKPIQWLTPNGNSVYIHRLSVHPNLQGKGLAQQMMDFAENHAREHRFVSVRLDTFSQNKRNQRFYEQRGYQKLGDIYFPKQSVHPFHCYELVL
ncbi:MAG: GNAT family N-acetyltransferase [Muricauda sp.]|jgi:ribosomal protein S18 acetylase RimI-like enzyme|nr:GNAT family N-acetyltransferase [Allomuricauda sp.]MBO6532421.1 GNAT family N-acetyltransferase [Allomuricauda sp.]MBO6587910.1 GNAT family N-acetyltransferase [Allomuricauda sp.]MBO6617535.1 GNAT family N-acetyltransferase [Allomuricauda sp.]MBO6643454.1 GNAT family N-acetyltransferase [Allomuricauda sp.]MBO6745870.1 GNAT family N-acetyltransferase [Allomuricauda sp.]